MPRTYIIYRAKIKTRKKIISQYGVVAPSLAVHISMNFWATIKIIALFHASVIAIGTPLKMEQKNIFFIENGTPKDGATTPFSLLFFYELLIYKPYVNYF